ncbi:hypothetical protein AN948_05460 [Rhodococcus sp. ADH]|uniref:DUF2637 domain-containing protein n=1 Tax=Rhodococcus sp. ADH TaxID=224843 RepID=UPI0006CDA059|nr:DUF2637 domain-containing protein [Rhodococcus sp. ADH]KPH20707.1 hypothetical protein AN948_05460 [Rhodococcus sp. ADH]
MNDFSLRAARIQLGALLAALALAIVIALGITTGAFVLSFAVQRDLARQALIPENLTWIFPAIVDSAILGATIAIVIISKLKMNRRDRGFYIALAVSVVVISILGNAFHAYNAAVDARQFVDGGGDLGFIPLAPAIAAALAIIPPALVLAFTHGITVLVKAVGIAYAAYRELVDSHAQNLQPVASAESITPAEGAVQADIATEAEASAAKTQIDAHRSFHAVLVSASSRNAVAGTGALATLALLTVQGPIQAAGAGAATAAAWWLLRWLARPATAVAQTSGDEETDLDFAPAFETVSSSDATATRPTATPTQNLSALKKFIANSDLPETVKDTAVRKLTNLNLTWEMIAQESKPPVAISTAWRRYQQFEKEARAAGFTRPPLPDLRSAEYPLESELVNI